MCIAATQRKLHAMNALEGNHTPVSKTCCQRPELSSCFPCRTGTKSTMIKKVHHGRPSEKVKRRVRFSRNNDMEVNISICEIIRPASDMSQSERQQMWYQRDEFIKSMTGFVETIKACRQCELTPTTTTTVSYSSVLRAVYDACCGVADDTIVDVPPSLATILALSASVYELRGLERNVEKSIGSQRKCHMKKRIEIIVGMNKLLSGMTCPYDVRADHLCTLSESLSRPGRVFGRVIGLADAQSAMAEYNQSTPSTSSPDATNDEATMKKTAIFVA